MHEIFHREITPAFCVITCKFCQRSKAKFVEAINSLRAQEDSLTQCELGVLRSR